MKVPALLCATMAGPALAEVVTCDLSGVAVRFEIDRTQFAPAIHKDEPARVRITTIQMGDAAFPAEPIIMDKVRGFWAAETDAMMVMQGDGTAVYVAPRTSERLTGKCEVLQ